MQLLPMLTVLMIGLGLGALSDEILGALAKSVHAAPAYSTQIEIECSNPNAWPITGEIVRP